MTGSKLTGCRCQCPACGDYFGNVVGFDRHRIGIVGAADRRCLAAEEMTAQGWVRNARGFWLRPSAERGPAGLQAPRVTPPTTHAPGP